MKTKSLVVIIGLPVRTVQQCWGAGSTAASTRAEGQRRSGSPYDVMEALVLSLLWLLIVGLIAGVLAPVIVSGRNSMSRPAAMVFGVVGSVVGGLSLGLLSGDLRHGAVGAAGLLGAVIALMIYNRRSARHQISRDAGSRAGRTGVRDRSTTARHPRRPAIRRTKPWSWGLAFRRYRVVLLVALLGFALVGALITPSYVVLLLAPPCGVVVACAMALLHPAFPEARSARRAVAFSGVGATLLVPAMVGIRQLGTPGVVVAMVVMGVGWVIVGGLIGELFEPAGRKRRLDLAGMRAFVHVLPTALLLEEWRATGERLAHGAAPDRRAEAVLLRQHLLEELSRRDPAGVARWLREGNGESPERYIRGDSDATT